MNDFLPEETLVDPQHHKIFLNFTRDCFSNDNIPSKKAHFLSSATDLEVDK